MIQEGPVTGIVFDIQRASLHDGPGLRTTVFLKGCPLRCAWCHNPESQKLQPETGQSGKVYGEPMSVDTVMEAVLADRAYYKRSGGGLTLSGGEPTVQYDFCQALLQAARAQGIHTCLDTCGHVPTDKLLALVPLVDLFHFDYKATGADVCQQWTGVDGQLIEHNRQALLKAGASLCLRCPIVPGANDSAEHLRRLDQFAASGAYTHVERLTYHDTGRGKYADLGRTPPALP